MEKKIRDQLSELYAIALDKKRNYIITYWGNEEWEITNRTTHEQCRTKGYFAARSWVVENMKAMRTEEG